MIALLKRLGALRSGRGSASPAAPPPRETREAVLRAEAEASLAAGDWTKVLELTSSKRDLAADVRLLVFRLSAARALKATAVIQEVGLAAAWLPMTVVMRRRIAHDLAAADMPEQAWRVLTADPATVADPRFLQSARAIKQKLTDPRLLAEVDAAIRKAGGEAPPAADYEHGYRESPGLTAQGTAAVHAGPGVPAAHVERLEADLAKFRDGQAKPSKPRVGVYENVFVDGSGQVWSEDGSILISQGAVAPKVSKADVAHIPLALHVSGRAKGLYPWLVEQVPKLSWLLEDGAPKPRLLLGEKGQGYELETLRLVGLDVADVVRGSRPVFVEKLLVAKVGLRSFPRWKRIAPIYDRIVARALTEASADASDRIYVSRSDASQRKMENEAAVEAALTARGFRICVLSETPLAEQIAAMSRAKVIVGAHGSGLAHIAVAQPGAKVIELLPICEGADTQRLNYAHLAIARGLEHHAWAEAQPAAKAPWSVHLDGFLAMLDPVLGEAPRAKA